MHAFRMSDTIVLHSFTNHQRIQWKHKQLGEHSYLTDERIEQLTQLGFVFGAIDRNIYPIANVKPRKPSKANATDAAKKKTGIAQGEEQQQENAPPGKRGTPKSRANDAAKRKISRSTKEPDKTSSAQGEDQLPEAVLEMLRKSASHPTSTNDATKRSPRGSKTSVPAEVTFDEEETNETGVVPSGKRGTPKTSANNAAKRKSNSRAKISISPKGALKEVELDETGTPKTRANKAAKRKADEEEPGVSQGEESTQKTVVAPPGSLGLIITNIAESKGTVISEVRSASVLADKISPGDRIIAIDGEDVSVLTASEISTIMADRSNSERVLTVRAPSPNQQFEFLSTKSSTKAKKKKKITKMPITGKNEIAVRERERMIIENAEAEAKRSNLQLIRAEREEAAAAAIVRHQDKDAKRKQVALSTAIATTPKERKRRIKWVIYAGKNK